MRVFFASRTGNVEALVGNLGVDATRIEDGNEKVSEPYVLFTYTDGFGDTPFEVDAFLDNNDNSLLKGVVVSGNHAYDPAFCGCADKIAEKTGAPILYCVEDSGTDEDLNAIKEKLASL